MRPYPPTKAHTCTQATNLGIVCVEAGGGEQHQAAQVVGAPLQAAVDRIDEQGGSSQGVPHGPARQGCSSRQWNGMSKQSGEPCHWKKICPLEGQYSSAWCRGARARQRVRASLPEAIRLAAAAATAGRRGWCLTPPIYAETGAAAAPAWQSQRQGHRGSCTDHHRSRQAVLLSVLAQQMQPRRQASSKSMHWGTSTHPPASASPGCSTPWMDILSGVSSSRSAGCCLPAASAAAPLLLLLWGLEAGCRRGGLPFQRSACRAG